MPTPRKFEIENGFLMCGDDSRSSPQESTSIELADDDFDPDSPKSTKSNVSTASRSLRRDGALVDFDEDTVSMTIVQVIHDSRALSGNKLKPNVVGNRLSLSMGLLLLTLFCQMYVLKLVWDFVCAHTVHDIRITYHKYETVMYSELIFGPSFSTDAPEEELPVEGRALLQSGVSGAPHRNCAGAEGCHVVFEDDITLNSPDECFDITVNGFRRGKPECFKPDNFQWVPEDLKSASCKISLSQPYFIGMVLFLWTLRCIAELRKFVRIFLCLVFKTSTIDSMENVFEGKHAEAGREEDVYVIQGLTHVMRCVITCCVIPHALIIVFLLWIGCRWLLATANFADLILNAVALEFILDLKELIFRCLAPVRNKTDLDSTKMLPEKDEVRAENAESAEAVIWLLIAITWVLAYMWKLQAVLPQYRWDVRKVCADWIEVRYEI